MVERNRQKDKKYIGPIQRFGIGAQNFIEPIYQTCHQVEREERNDIDVR